MPCDPLTLDNGMISYDDSTLMVGTMASYSCNTGYVLSGESSLTCVFVEANSVVMWDFPVSTQSCESESMWLTKCGFSHNCNCRHFVVGVFCPLFRGCPFYMYKLLYGRDVVFYSQF